MSHYKPYPAYKDSGVEWIGKVPEHWGVLPIKRGAQLRNERRNDSPYGWPYVGLEDVDSGSGRYTPKDGTSRQSEDSMVGVFSSGNVLYGKLRPYLRKAIVAEQDGVCSTEFLVLSAGRARASWLHRWLLTTDVTQQIEAGCEGAKMPRADWEHVGSIPMPLPPSAEQASIAAAIDRETARIDALIAKKTRFIELLQEKRQALITHAVTKGLEPNVKMKDSGVDWIGEVPEHWRVARLKHILAAPLQYGANEPGEDGGAFDVRYIRITDLDPMGRLRNDSVKRLPSHKAESYLLKDGDILFARSGATVGKTYLYKEEDGPACFAGYLIRARPKTAMALPDFVTYAVRSHYYWSYIHLTTIQATIENVSAERYGDFTIALPDLSEQQALVTWMNKATSRIDALIAKSLESIDLLRERRSAFITAAVTGQIDLREAA
jgi:type I restriction enzyme S subunit